MSQAALHGACRVFFVFIVVNRLSTKSFDLFWPHLQVFRCANDAAERDGLEKGWCCASLLNCALYHKSVKHFVINAAITLPHDACLNGPRSLQL